MVSIVDFLNTNKEWLFSGIGTSTIFEILAVIGGIISIIIWWLKKNDTKATQNIGNNSSNNNQAGRDIKIK